MKGLPPILAWKFLRPAIYGTVLVTAYLTRLLKRAILQTAIDFSLLSIAIDVLTVIVILELGWWWLGHIYRRTWQRLETARQSASYFQTLFRFSEILSRETNETSFYRDIVQGLHTLLAFQEARIYRALPDKENWSLQTFVGQEPLPVEWRIHLEAGQNPLAFEEKILVYLPDTARQASPFSWVRKGSEVLIALRSEEGIHALLVAARPSKDAFSAGDLDALRITASLATAVLQRIRSTYKQDRRAQELLALQDTMADILTEREITRLLKAILERAVTLLHASGGDLGLYDPRSGMTQVVVSQNLGEKSIGRKLRLGEGAMGWVSKYRKPISIQDYASWHNRSPQYNLPPHTSVLAVPLEASGELIGTIGIIKETGQRPFDKNDVELLTRFAQQAALALETTRLYQQAVREGEKRKILYETSQDIVAALSLEKVYQAIHRAVERLMPADTFVLTLADYQKKVINPVYIFDKGRRYREAPIPISAGLSGHVISTGNVIHIKDIEAFEQENSEQVRHFGTAKKVRSVLAVPIYEKERVAGVLSAQSYQAYAYSEEDEQLLSMLANQAAIALENARLFARMREMAIRDALTGVFNRHYFFRRASYELARAQRYGRPLGIIMLDIDHFKQINDTYGHGVGDQVLRGIAAMCQNSLRKSDILGRYGGEEFVILLPETTIDTTRFVANRLHAHLASQPIATDAGQVEVTVSVGITAYIPTDESLKSIFRRADQALYTAKNKGRNRVCQVLTNEIET